MKTKWLLVLSLLLCFACDNRAKVSAEKAPAALDFMFPLVERDTAQIRKGLPEGAKALGKLLDEDPGHDPEGLRRDLEKARAGVTDLAIAKSTFFVFVGLDGVVLRAEAEPDLAAGGSLVKEIPDAKRILEGQASTEVFGSMHGLRGVERGGDLQWVVGHPVVTEKGKKVGAFVTGWSYRKYADFLEGALRRHLVDTAEDKKRAAPLAYVLLARGDKAYGGAVTPDVDAEAVGKLGLPAKVGEGLHSESITIEGQTFALVAKKLPALDKDTVLVLLFSVV
ncbi:MAG: hypothetical protein FJ096_11545 [Deltaproteobacteria bacterium]|nr:hypothetical protein [Deltaproteobacteria bacterium]